MVDNTDLTTGKVETIYINDSIEVKEATPENLPEIKEPEYDFIFEIMESDEGFFKSIGSWITDTAKGRNTVGRTIGIGLDALTFIAPYGSKIDRIRQKAKILLGLDQRKFKYNPPTMTNQVENTKDKIVRILKQDSTKAALTGIISVVGIFFGMNSSASEVAQVFISSGVGIVAGLFGIYSAYRSVRNLFTDDAKKTENK